MKKCITFRDRLELNGHLQVNTGILKESEPISVGLAEILCLNQTPNSLPPVVGPHFTKVFVRIALNIAMTDRMV